MTPKGGLPGVEVPATRSQCQLSPERWSMLLSLAQALGFTLPGPHRQLNRDQILTFWSRALRVSAGPQRMWGRSWTGWGWPRCGWSDKPRLVAYVRLDQDQDRLAAWLVLLHEIITERHASGEGPPPPVELVAEVGRLIAADRVRTCLD